MKVVRYLMLVGVLLAASAALAQDRERPREGQRDRPARRQPLRAAYEAVLAQLNLDAAQQARTKQILDTSTQDMTNWNKQYAEELRNLQRQRFIRTIVNLQAEFKPSSGHPIGDKPFYLILQGLIRRGNPQKNIQMATVVRSNLGFHRQFISGMFSGCKSRHAFNHNLRLSPENGIAY